MLLQKGTYSDLLCNTLIQYSDTIDVTMLKYLDKYCSLLALTIQLAPSFDICKDLSYPNERNIQMQKKLSSDKLSLIRN